MKKVMFLIVGLLVVVSWSLPVIAMGGPTPPKSEGPATPVAMAEKIFLIDNFESGSLKNPRDWWTFDISKAEASSNEKVAAAVGDYSMHLAGNAKNWYVGGVGTYIAKEGQDLSKYSFFSMDVYGYGPGSGTLKIELYDDDNGNWQIEQDQAKNFVPLYDDKWTYEVKIDWDGWKKVMIPLADFVDENPGVGDDIWNPAQTKGSGGLLQLQFVCLAGSDMGSINFNVDNVMLTVGEK